MGPHRSFHNKRFSVYPSPANKEITFGIGGHDSSRPRGTWVTIKGSNREELRNENAEAFENILQQYGEIVQPVSTTYYRDVNVLNGNRSCCIVLNRELPDSIDYEAQDGQAYKLYLNWKGKKLFVDTVVISTSFLSVKRKNTTRQNWKG